MRVLNFYELKHGLTIADVMKQVREANKPEPFRWPAG